MVCYIKTTVSVYSGETELTRSSTKRENEKPYFLKYPSPRNSSKWGRIYFERDHGLRK